MIRNAVVAGWLALLLLAWRPVCAAVNPEGVSGVLNTPTAEVVNDGVAVATLGRFLRHMDNGVPDSIARSYSMTVGYLPGLEITARFVDFPTVADNQGTTNFQDRSVSLKYRVALNQSWAAAIGATDIGGQSQINESVYGVVTYQAQPGLELSAGMGSERLAGAFASARWSPHERLSLLGEYDTETVNYGVEVRPFKGLALTAGMVNGHAAFSSSYSFPLDPRGPGDGCAPVQLERCTREYPDALSQAEAVRDALVRESFENVVVGLSGDTLFIECENRRFTEQVDALAVAAALAIENAGPDIERIEIAPKIDDIPQLVLSAGVNELLAYFSGAQACPDGVVTAPYEIGRFPCGTVFACEGNKKPGSGEVQVRLLNGFEITRPGWPTMMTKWGLGLEERLFLARGLRLTARQDWFMLNDLQEENEKTLPVNRDAVLTYTGDIARDMRVQASAGYLGNARYGALASAGYYLPQGRWKLGGRYGYIRNEMEGASDKEDGLALGDLSYFEPGLSWQVTLLGGQFLEGDRGLRIESSRSFGPTDLVFFAYDTNESKAHGGFQFFVPLPWYNQQRHGAWRVTGAPYFPYQYRTDSDPWGETGPVGLDVDSLRQHLRPEYVQAHLAQFRRAVQLFTSSRR